MKERVFFEKVKEEPTVGDSIKFEVRSGARISSGSATQGKIMVEVLDKKGQALETREVDIEKDIVGNKKNFGSGENVTIREKVIGEIKGFTKESGEDFAVVDVYGNKDSFVEQRLIPKSELKDQVEMVRPKKTRLKEEAILGGGVAVERLEDHIYHYELPGGFEAVAVTREGPGRSYHEDAVGILPDERGNIFVLADGAGGMGRGDSASAAVVSACLEKKDNFQDGIRLASRAINVVKEEKGGDPMSTVVQLEFDKQGEYIMNYLGDSFVYEYDHDGKCTYASKRDSKSQEVADRDHGGNLDYVRHGQDNNKITKFVCDDMSKMEFNDPIHKKLHPNGFLFAASDGMDVLDEKEIGKILAKNGSDLGRAGEMIAKAARQRKPGDNYTFILIRKK